MRCPNNALRLAVALGLLLVGCTLDDGVPWGRVESVQLVSELDVPNGRLDGDALKTALDYRIQLEPVVIQYGPIKLIQQAAGAQSFDPANPPAGCSLCHNGHCHCDGALVDYEDLQVSAGGDGGTVVLGALTHAVSLAQNTPVTGALEPLDAPDLPRGVLAAVSVDLLTVTLSGTVSDATGERFEGEVPFHWTLQLDTPLSGPLGTELDADSGWRLALALEHTIGSGLFDTVDFAALLTEDLLPNAPPEALRQALVEVSDLSAHITLKN